MCPSATPRSLGGASCASAGVEDTRARHPARASSRRVMSGLRSGTRLHEVGVDAHGRHAYGLAMTTLLKPLSIWALVGVITLAVSSTMAGQDQAPPGGQGRGRAAGPPPPPPEPQAGH